MLQVNQVVENFMFAIQGNILALPRELKWAYRQLIQQGVDDIAYHGAEFAVKWLLPRPRRMGLGMRGWPECVGLDKGYVPVVSLDNSTRSSLRVAVIVTSYTAGQDPCKKRIETGVLVVNLTGH